MAGFYTDVPAPRLAYDRDGTRLFFVDDGGGITEYPSSLAVLNDENSGTEWMSGFGGGWAVLIFPQLRDIVAYHLAVRTWVGGTLETSTNTTNGQDGTWTTVTSNYSFNNDNPAKPNYRTVIYAVAMNGIIALKFRRGATGSRAFKQLHLYGGLATGETPDRLRLWHPTLDEPLDDKVPADGAYFDWGDTAQSTSADRTFRIKNNSVTLTANSIAINQQTLTETTPSINSQFTFSNGGAFAASLNIGNLSPGQLSGVITKRRTIQSNAQLGLWSSRTNVEAGSWS